MRTWASSELELGSKEADSKARGVMPGVHRGQDQWHHSGAKEEDRRGNQLKEMVRTVSSSRRDRRIGRRAQGQSEETLGTTTLTRGQEVDRLRGQLKEDSRQGSHLDSNPETNASSKELRGSSVWQGVQSRRFRTRHQLQEGRPRRRARTKNCCLAAGEVEECRP